MLKYKLTTINSEFPLMLDKRLSYNDTSIIHILTFIYKQYKAKNYTIRKLYKAKLTHLSNLNFKLVTKKVTYKTLLYKLDFNPQMIKQLYQLFKDNSINSFENKVQIYRYLTRAIENINSDIKLINQLKKSFKYYIKEYENVNLYYSETAKITKFDIQQLHKKVLTKNSKEVLYFYLILFKKSKSKGININNSINPFLSMDRLKAIINKSIKYSFEKHLKKSVDNTIITTTNNLINKWL